jgi:hypothetical protein
VTRLKLSDYAWEKMLVNPELGVGPEPINEAVRCIAFAPVVAVVSRTVDYDPLDVEHLWPTRTDYWTSYVFVDQKINPKSPSRQAKNMVRLLFNLYRQHTTKGNAKLVALKIAHAVSILLPSITEARRRGRPLTHEVAHISDLRERAEQRIFTRGVRGGYVKRAKLEDLLDDGSDEQPIEPKEDRSLICPEEFESATGHYDPAGPSGGTDDDGVPVCAGCGSERSEHTLTDDENGETDDLDMGEREPERQRPEERAE